MSGSSFIQPRLLRCHHLGFFFLVFPSLRSSRNQTPFCNTILSPLLSKQRSLQLLSRQHFKPVKARSGVREEGRSGIKARWRVLVQVVSKLGTTYMLICVKLDSLMQSQHWSWACAAGGVTVRWVPLSPLLPPVLCLPVCLPLFSISHPPWPWPLPTCCNVRGGVDVPPQKVLLSAQPQERSFVNPTIARAGLILLKEWMKWDHFKVEILPKSNILKPSVKSKHKSYGVFFKVYSSSNMSL